MRVFIIVYRDGKTSEIYLEEKTITPAPKGVIIGKSSANSKKGFQTFVTYRDASYRFRSLYKRGIRHARILGIMIPDSAKKRLRYERLPYKIGGHALYLYTPQIFLSR